MRSIRIAGAQMQVLEDIGANAARVLGALERAREAGADILLTPEGSVSGYTHLFDRARAEQELERVVSRAAKLGIALALGTCRVEDDGRCYDELRFYDGSGAFLGFQAKTLLTGTMEDTPRGEIQHFAMGQLQVLLLNGIRVGGLVCNDLWANPECTPQPDPHLTHRLATMGAQIIFHSVNGGRDGSDMSQNVIRAFHDANLRMRARVDRLFIATVDNAFPPDLGTSAPGGIVGPDGAWIVQSPRSGEHVFAGTVRLP